MATDTKGYRFVVTNAPEADAHTTYNARTCLDDAIINAEARVYQARIAGLTVWAVQLLPEIKPTVYLTLEQATKLGLCHCGKPAEYVGFEGLRCNQHQKYGMSMLCSTPDCTKMSDGGFSYACRAHGRPVVYS